MKFLILPLLLISFSSIAQICEENSKLGSLSDFIPTKCFNEEVQPEDIEYTAVTKDAISSLCKKCQNVLFEKISVDKDVQDERKAIYGKTVLNEFQKELSLLSIDLMRVRSAFQMDFPTEDIVKSCNIETKLVMPPCLDSKQAASYKAQVLQIKNSLATELSDIISKKPNLDLKAGLFTKRKNSCGIDDADAIFSHMRYAETLLTSDLIFKLKQLKIKNGQSFDTATNGKLPDDIRSELIQLSLHPVFKSVLNDTTSLNNFLDEASKIKSTNATESNSMIVELLFQKKHTRKFGDKIKDRCNGFFSKTSDYLNDIYCKEKKFVADNLASMQIISGSKFSRMPKDKAENELKAHCSQINLKDNKTKGFSEIIQDIHGNASNNLVSVPLSEFKEDVYERMVRNVSENICSAKKSACEQDSLDQKCLLLKYYNKTKTDKHYQEMANASSDNINIILRSLVGTGVPQKDGKVDTEAIALLKSEGILPGGDTTSRPPQQTASAFHKTVSSQQAQTQVPQPVKAAVVPQTKTETEVQSPYAQSAARNYGPEEESTGSPSKHEPSSKIKSSSKTNKFSHLSDDEQQRIMDLMKRAKKAGGKTAKAASDEELSFDGAQAMPSALATANLGAQMAGSGVANVAQAAALAGNGGKKAVLDTIKKASSLNEAMIDANKNRQVATSGPAAGPSEVSLSKISSNENEIKIKVPETELSQVNEFKEKLKVLLNAHSQEISVAGTDEKFVVRLNNFEIKVVFNKALNTFEADCADDSFPKDYLKTILNYFNVTLKGGSGKREALLNHLKQ